MKMSIFHMNRSLSFKKCDGKFANSDFRLRTNNIEHFKPPKAILQ